MEISRRGLFSSAVGAGASLVAGGVALASPMRAPASVVKGAVTIDNVRSITASWFGITVADVLTDTRSRHVARARLVGMYLAKKLTPHTLPEIGRGFGYVKSDPEGTVTLEGRSLSSMTVFDAIRMIEDEAATSVHTASALQHDLACLEQWIIADARLAS